MSLPLSPLRFVLPPFLVHPPALIKQSCAWFAQQAAAAGISHETRPACLISVSDRCPCTSGWALQTAGRAKRQPGLWSLLCLPPVARQRALGLQTMLRASAVPLSKALLQAGRAAEGPALALRCLASLAGGSWSAAQQLEPSARSPTSAAAAAAAATRCLRPADAAHLAQTASFAAAASKARSAALRRLQRAGSRAAAGSRGHEAALARQAAGGGEVEAGPGTDVVPREGAASSVEVASVVDHPALIITRPVEW